MFDSGMVTAQLTPSGAKELVVKIVDQDTAAGRRHEGRLVRWRAHKEAMQCTHGQFFQKVKPGEWIELICDSTAPGLMREPGGQSVCL